MDGDLILNITFPKTNDKSSISGKDTSVANLNTKSTSVKSKQSNKIGKKFKPKLLTKENATNQEKLSPEVSSMLDALPSVHSLNKSRPKRTQPKKELSTNETLKKAKVVVEQPKVPTKKSSQSAYVNPVPKSGIFQGNPEIPDLQCVIEPLKSTKSIYSTDKSFSDLDILPRLKTYICEKMKFEHLTKVQVEALPVLLSGKDALITAETGSGKTLAYAIPVVHNLQAIKPPLKRNDGPNALVFAPTRELALQSYDVFHSLTQAVIRIVPTCIIGGQKRKSEKARLRKGANIIVSTPGRFIDHLDNTCCLNLENVQWLVFDEADRLLDMGFQANINKILAAVKEKSKYKQQVVLLSATLTAGVEKLVNLSLNDPVRVKITPDKKADFMFIEKHSGLKLEKASLPSSLTQYIAVVPMKIRLISLLAFINFHCIRLKEKLLVFLSCRDSVVFHHDILLKCNFAEYNPESSPLFTFQLHGGMTQQERTCAVQKFKKSDYGVIFCTDVAARGLDIPNVHWVIQYDSPGSPVNYIHRVGRTARAGNEGNALLYLTPSETAYAYLLSAFDITVSELKLSTIISDVVNYKLDHHSQSLKVKQAEEIAGSVHSSLERQVHQDTNLMESAKKAYLSFVRAYATYPPSLKKVFHVRNLHLGHVAKSFALTESPTEIAGVVRNNMIRKAKQSDFPSKRARTAFADVVDRKVGPKSKTGASQLDIVSEFSSGLEKTNRKSRETTASLLE